MKYYILLFFGAFFAGDSFVFPGIYLALEKTISLTWFFVVVVSATVLSDAIWYLFGRVLSIKKIRRLSILKNRQENINRILNSFEKYGIRIIFLSKFIYGTRIITQIIFGSVKYNFFKYLFLNFSIIFVWLGLITTISFFTKQLLEMTNIQLSSELSVIVVLIIILIIYLWTKIILKKKKYL